MNPSPKNRSPQHPSVTDSSALTQAATEELVWFFGVASRARFTAFDSAHVGTDPADPHIAGPYRAIRKWLLEMTNFDAGVLKSAYLPSAWPDGLRSALGRLTGIVVRLAAIEFQWPEEKSEQEVLEARVAARLQQELDANGPPAVARFLLQAKGLYRVAMTSYIRERGRGPSVVQGHR